MPPEPKGIEQLIAELRAWVGALEAADAERRRAEEALRRAHDELEERVQERTAALAASEERYRTLYQAVSGSVLVWNAAGELVEGNETAEEIFAVPFDQMRGHGWETLWTARREDGQELSPGERPALVALRSGEPVRNFLIELTSADGERRWLQGNAIPVRGADGAVREVVTTSLDVTARRRVEALTVAQKQVLELIATGADLTTILEALVGLLEAQSPRMLCSILLLDEEGRHLHHGAAPSLPAEYNEAIDGVEIGPDVGSCGTAAYRGEAVIVSDIATDPLWADYRDLAAEYGLRACWSTPIFARSGQVLGTFAMYYREPREPSSYDFELIEVATHIAGIAIERTRTETVLYQAKQAEGRLEGVLLAGRELAHLLNNNLAVAAGALNLLEARAALTAEQVQLVRDGLRHIDQAARHLQQLQRVVRVETKETPVGPSLDLARSSRP